MNFWREACSHCNFPCGVALLVHRDVWKIYLEKGEYEKAKDYARVSHGP